MGASATPTVKGHADPEPRAEAVAGAPASGPADEGLLRWQDRLLPLMAGLLLALTVFFFAASCAQLVYLHRRIEQAPRLAWSELVPTASMAATQAERMEQARFAATIALEASTLEHRYHLAGVALMSQLWVRYLAFVTGMALALIGAAFTLGKLQERPSEFSAAAGTFAGTLRSSSPGLFLALCGTALMLAAIAIRREAAINDGPIYLGGWSVPTSGTATPNSLGEPELPPRKSGSE